MKCGKSMGLDHLDDVSVEMFKKGGKAVIVWLVRLCNAYYETVFQQKGVKYVQKLCKWDRDISTSISIDLSAGKSITVEE